MSGHSLHSPSKAKTWMNCPGSVNRLLAAMREPGWVEEDTGPYAAEGSAAHALAAYCLEQKKQPLACLGMVFPEWPEWPVTEEMAQAVQTYVDAVRLDLAAMPGALLFVEHRMGLTRWIQEPDAGGTSDVVILHPDLLEIRDFKFGRGVIVPASDPQLKLYALGAIPLAKMLFGKVPPRIRLHIHQPRAGHYDRVEISAEDLMVFAEEVVRADAASRQPDAPLIPGEAQCKRCLGKSLKATCRALAQETASVVSFGAASIAEFANLDEKPMPVLRPLEAISPDAVDAMLKRLSTIKDWIADFEAYAMKLGLAGQLPSWKIVEGRQGNTAWTDKDAVERALKRLHWKKAEIYTQVLISPTQAKKQASPEHWAKLEPLTGRSSGKPTLVPLSDKRPAIKSVADASEFPNLSPEESSQ